MIKLTICSASSEAKSLTLDKKKITIGSGEDADLRLPSLQDIHVTIDIEAGRVLVINSANDPFTSLNGHPFGKKTLLNGDTLQIGNYQIQLEWKEEEEEEELQESDLVTDEDLESIDIDALIQEVEQLDISHEDREKKKQKELLPTPEKSVDNLEAKNSSNANDFNNTQGEQEAWYRENHEKENSLFETRFYSIHWIRILVIFMTLLVLGIAVSTILYFNVSSKNIQEEKKIAAGISDIAMAITHARLHQITPNKQNWSDPDFIFNNLSIVLSPALPSQAPIDNEGHFNKSSYILRIYTSQDMSRFLVIAQPSPNLLQWLHRKATLVIDSTTMELRKIVDLKNLNRLLTNKNPLEGKNGLEITRTIKEGKRMPLASLVGKKNHWGFSPPKALAFIRPGAQYYIYNAPRYYPFGEYVLKKAMKLHQSPENTEEMHAFHTEIKEIAKFPDLILYTPQGLQAAIEKQKMLTTISPDNNFLVAYLKLGAKGYITSSHLLMNAERDTLTPELMEMADVFFQEREPVSSDHEPQQESAFESNNPLYLQLKALATERTRELKPIAHEIIARLHQENSMVTADFADTVDALLKEYKHKEDDFVIKIRKEVIRLHQEYADVPFEEFLRFLEATRLSSALENTRDIEKENEDGFAWIDNTLAEYFEKIPSATSLKALDSIVQEAFAILSPNTLPDPSRLIVYQNMLYEKVLERLSYLLLAPTSRYAQEPPKESEKMMLQRILKNAWVTDPDEKTFFLNEFDHLKK